MKRYSNRRRYHAAAPSGNGEPRRNAAQKAADWICGAEEEDADAAEAEGATA